MTETSDFIEYVAYQIKEWPEWETIDIEKDDAIKLVAEIRELKTENDQLRAELANVKPDWDIAPEWASWLARDISGTWNWYSAKPAWNDGYWDSSFATEVAWLSASNEPEKRPTDE